MFRLLVGTPDTVAAAPVDYYASAFRMSRSS